MRRKTAWDDQLFNQDVATGSRVLLLLVEDVADPEKRGCTLVRMIFGINLLASNPGAVSGQQKVSMGVMVVSDDAFLAGSAAMPDPTVDAEFPVGGWLFRAQYIVQDETLASGIIAPLRIEKDIRSQRKLDRASLVFRAENDSMEGSTFSVRMVGLIRCLYKLP